MVRLIRLLVSLAILVWITSWFAGRLSFKIDFIPFAIGIIIAGLAGFMEARIAGWWETVNRPNKSQVVKLDTKETPAQITNAAFWAIVRGGFIIVSSLALLASQLPEMRGIFTMFWENFGFLSR